MLGQFVSYYLSVENTVQCSIILIRSRTVGLLCRCVINYFKPDNI